MAIPLRNSKESDILLTESVTDNGFAVSLGELFAAGSFLFEKNTKCLFEPLHIIYNSSAKPTPKLFIIHQRKRLHYSLRKSVLMNDEC